ncbi:MAG TPA: TIR domain-containing protein [Steroidobacteraceae bacterium]|nr:TIR domain-containing protein [Steroidobacteraceae bacterium]
MAETSQAVFLSYASQDAEAAQEICSALRAAGIQVFLDQRELRGGDVWDQKIRREIHDCALFVPVISANTAVRHEGYFRLEWDLADQRTHMMARSRVFILPVCLDTTTEVQADVPESFRRVQWTRLPGGSTPSAFVERVRGLLSPELAPSSAGSVAPVELPQPMRTSRRSKPLLLALVAVVLFAALAYFLARQFWIPKHVRPDRARAVANSSAFSPPPHSIAVLPFVNLSGDASQDYFSDGLTEELLNSLAEINELQVAARTSSFSFKERPDIPAIAHKLNVGAVLEGSVRRSAHTLRITAQLINAVTGFQVWSKTYDRDLGDVLQLQTEIATAVASALKVTLLGDVAAKVELGGTRDPAAFDAYLRAAKAVNLTHGAKDLPVAVAAYTEAIGLDPHYALAFAGRSIALSEVAAEADTASAARDFDKARTDAGRALDLAPNLAQAHAALALVSELGTLDFTQASESYRRALALAPGNAEVLRGSGIFAARMGHFDAALAATRRALVLDPLARQTHSAYSRALYAARRYREALVAFAGVMSLDPDFRSTYAERGLTYYGLGDLQSARASCELKPDFWYSQQCLAVVYDKLGRHADAEAELAKLRASTSDGGAYQCATIYAQWGNRAKALEWLEKALRLRDPGLVNIKTDPLLDSLRKEPRFRAIERELKFPG